MKVTNFNDSGRARRLKVLLCQPTIPLFLTFAFLGALGVVILALRRGLPAGMELISFRWDDLPALPKIIRPERSILFGHFFGDFTQIVRMNRLPSPYEFVEGYPPSQYPPLAHVLLLPYGLVDLAIGWFAWFVSSLAFLFYAIRKGLTQSNGLTDFTFCLVTIPVFSSLDRGNSAIVAIAALAIAVSDFDTKPRSAVFAMTLAISLKPYVVLYLLVFGTGQRSRRFTIKVLCLTTVVNLVAFSFYSGSLITNAKGMLRALVLAGQSENYVTNHSILALLPKGISLYVMLFGYSCTALIIVYQAQGDLAKRLWTATFGMLAFSNQLPLYQLGFIVPMLVFGRREHKYLPHGAQYILTLILFVPKQLEIAGISLAKFDGATLILLWIISVKNAIREGRADEESARSAT